MRYWLLTDTHFGHENIKKYCDRPDGFEDLIFKNLNPSIDEGICPGDVLIHLGDVCFGSGEMQAEWHTKLFETLPEQCRKVLVKGNHDKKSYAWYYAQGWDFVCESFTMKAFGKNFLFKHRCITQEVVPDDIDFIIHGHNHNNDYEENNCGWVEYQEGKILVMSEHHYKPIDLQSIVFSKTRCEKHDWNETIRHADIHGTRYDLDCKVCGMHLNSWQHPEAYMKAREEYTKEIYDW